ncbi:hypothetical protein GO730_00265 [Spirosoma sp. HMF3257]|uniref:Uncharacterized protein n=1 Tax=Spirosoma telluris TaxID=2183553 RepID=A0A327NG50_9BACT|nr:hypothetical protein [Spirosoma telluris]RAI73239.1 hypothetical protein HMF3257_00260 [Spirosoma telluris]
MAKLLLADDEIQLLTRESGAYEVPQQFEEFRVLLWDVIEVSPDPAPYTHAWHLINWYGKVDLLDFQKGNDSSLYRKQEKVRGAIQLSPLWINFPVPR